MTRYLVSHGGRRIDLPIPAITQIDIEDIAHGLAREERFNGNTHAPYSVAQHSVHAANLLARYFQKDDGRRSEAEKTKAVLGTLLHDASEAYLGDIVSPLKHFLPDYENMERQFMSVIHHRFAVHLNDADKSLVKSADNQMFVIETFIQARHHPSLYGFESDLDETKKFVLHTIDWLPSLSEISHPWNRERAAQEFLSLFNILYHPCH